MTNPCEELANAIIIQACRDYRESLIMLRRHPRDTQAKQTAAECESFFRSEWFGLLTNLDGIVLMQKIKREVNDR